MKLKEKFIVKKSCGDSFLFVEALTWSQNCASLLSPQNQGGNVGKRVKVAMRCLGKEPQRADLPNVQPVKGETIIIGRSNLWSLEVPQMYPEVSRMHCILRVYDGDLYIVNLGRLGTKLVRLKEGRGIEPVGMKTVVQNEPFLVTDDLFLLCLADAVWYLVDVQKFND